MTTTQKQFNTESRKDKHLSREERVVIQEKYREGWSNRDIVKYLGPAPQTKNNEINRGTTAQRQKPWSPETTIMYARQP